MALVIKLRRGTTGQWAGSSRVLQIGELGLDTTLNKIKSGDGTSLWGALPFLNVLPSELTELSQDAVNAALVAGTGLSKTYNDGANTITLNVDTATIATTNYVDSAITGVNNQSGTTYVLVSDVGSADGVASLGPDGKIPDSEIPAAIARLASPTFTGTVAGITKTMVGLGNVDNTTDANKPVSTAAQTALDLKAPLSSPGLTGTPTAPLAVTGTNTTQIATTSFVQQELNILTTGAPAALNTLDELAAALGDDANYAATITTALGNKAPIANPTFTGTVGGITKSMVGLGNVDNTTDANKPVSTATQTALDLKLNLSDPSVDYYITNSGSGAYLINGVSNGLITFEKGKKYRIHVNATGHPFWIQTVSGAYSSGNVYSTGITNGGAQSGHIIVELPQDAPDNLYYACQFHSSMSGPISVQSDDAITINSKAGNYTILPIDSGRLIEIAGAGTVTITDSASFPVGFSVDVLRTGDGAVSIAGNGFTPNATPGLTLRTKWSSATLLKRALNSWVVLGDLSA
jgi:hypothetical protein